MSKIDLHKGNCLDVLPRLKSGSIDLVFADPPFNLGKSYGNSEDNRDNYYDWCNKWIKLCFDKLKPGGAFYLMTIQNHVGHMMIFMEKYGEFRNQIIWLNSSMPVKNRFCIGYQPILYFVKNGGDFVFNYGFEIRKSKAVLPWGRQNKGNSIKDIWDDIPFVSGGCMASKEAILRDDSKKKIHPTQMPVRLANRVIGYSSNEGELILDPFMGSGTTAIACLQTNRNFIGIEVVPEYIDLTEKRIADTRLQLRMNLS